MPPCEWRGCLRASEGDIRTVWEATSTRGADAGRQLIKYFLDEEFVDTGSIIELISIGLIAEDGRGLYLQSAEFNDEDASPWVKENVLPHLVACPDLSYERHFFLGGKCLAGSLGKVECPWRSRAQIASEILTFMDIEKYGKPELWSWCGCYDYVALCQLFGTMMDLPAGYPHYIKDIQYLLDERGLSDDMLPQPKGTTHHALEDARYMRQLWELLQRR